LRPGRRPPKAHLHFHDVSAADTASVMVWTATQYGQFLDLIEADRLYALYHLACYWGLRHGELDHLDWADLDLATQRLRVRGDVKSEDSDRIITIDQGTADVLRSWQERQLFERLEWDSDWQDGGRVFTREDGSPLRRGLASVHFKSLVSNADLPPIRFHDLRHWHGHDVASCVRPPPAHGPCQQVAKMITDAKQGACAVAQTPWSGAEARGFEPRMGVNPNRISSSGHARPDRFSVDQRPWPVLPGRHCTAVNCNPNCNPAMSVKVPGWKTPGLLRVLTGGVVPLPLGGPCRLTRR
jgi:hypothetical protein